MKRYSNIKQGARWDGKRILTTVLYPEIPTSESDIFIISKSTDYLDTLAFQYYGDPTLWWIIALANDNMGKGRLSVPIGIQLRIPMNTSTILSDYERINQ
jgi:nucleoid-associated protein YgaU